MPCCTADQAASLWVVSNRQAVSPPANDQNSEHVALTTSEINRAMGITDNIPESSYGSVNSELLEKETTTSMLTLTGIQNSKNGVANPNSLLSIRHRSHRLPKPALTPEHHTSIIIHAAESTLVVVPMADLIFISLVNLAQAPMAVAPPTACVNRRSIHCKRANTPHRKRGGWSKNDNTSAQHKHLASTVMLCRHSASTCNNILLDGASSETEPCPRQCTHHQWKHGGRIPSRSQTGMPGGKKRKQYRDYAVMCLPSRQSSEQEYCSLTLKGELEEVIGHERERHQTREAGLNWQLIFYPEDNFWSQVLLTLTKMCIFLVYVRLESKLGQTPKRRSKRSKQPRRDTWRNTPRRGNKQRTKPWCLLPTSPSPIEAQKENVPRAPRAYNVTETAGNETQQQPTSEEKGTKCGRNTCFDTNCCASAVLGFLSHCACRHPSHPEVRCKNCGCVWRAPYIQRERIEAEKAPRCCSPLGTSGRSEGLEESKMPKRINKPTPRHGSCEVEILYKFGFLCQ